MGNEDDKIEQIRAALAPHGIFLRGVVQFDGDGPQLETGRARTVVLLGNVGGSIWPAFSAWRQNNPNKIEPLDTWSMETISPVAEAVGGRAWFPSERPWQPFQQWAMHAEELKASSLGLLIHPQYGLWHGYRGAIGLLDPVAHLAFEPQPHPCDHCLDKPCLTTCPASAVTLGQFNVKACRTYLATPKGDATCMQGGCIARNACPVGERYRYPTEHLQFHMAALSR